MSAKRVVVDTNVVVSALTAGGVPQTVLKGWIAREFQALISEELKQEINEVLRRSKFISVDKKRRIILGTLFNLALIIKPKKIKKPVFPDEKDHFLYELAVEGEALAIVTGDKGLLKTKRVSGIEVLSPAQFCKKFRIK